MNIHVGDLHSALFPREKYLFKNRTAEVPPNSYYHSLYPKIIQDIEVRNIPESTDQFVPLHTFLLLHLSLSFWPK